MAKWPKKKAVDEEAEEARWEAEQAQARARKAAEEEAQAKKDEAAQRRYDREHGVVPITDAEVEETLRELQENGEMPPSSDEEESDSDDEFQPELKVRKLTAASTAASKKAAPKPKPKPKAAPKPASKAKKAQDDEDEEDKKITLVRYDGDGVVIESSNAGNDYGGTRELFTGLRSQMAGEPGHVELVVGPRTVATTARGGLFLMRPPAGGRKPLKLVTIHALAHRTVKVFGAKIEVNKFGGVKYLTELAKVLRPMKKGQVTQSKVFFQEQVTLKDETTGEKKSGFVVQDGPWPGDAKPNPKWLFVIAEEPVEEEESEEDDS